MKNKLIESDKIYDINSYSFDDFEILLKRAIKEELKYLIIFYNIYDYDKYEIMVFTDYNIAFSTNDNNIRNEYIEGNIIEEELYNKHFREFTKPYLDSMKRKQLVGVNKIKKISFSNSSEKYYKVPPTDDDGLITKALKYRSDDKFLDGYVIKNYPNTDMGNRVGLYNLNGGSYGKYYSAILLYEHSKIIMQRLSKPSIATEELIRLIKKQELPFLDKMKYFFSRKVK